MDLKSKRERHLGAHVLSMSGCAQNEFVTTFATASRLAELKMMMDFCGATSLTHFIERLETFDETQHKCCLSRLSPSDIGWSPAQVAECEDFISSLLLVTQ